MSSSRVSCADISVFYDHDIQSILALFLTRPELYKDYSTYGKDCQDYFFSVFKKFASGYYNFADEENVYFGSTQKDSIGKMNVCGGVGSRAGKATRYFKDRFGQSEKSREMQIDAFSRKYGVTFSSTNDPRLFIGVTEIWKKLDTAQEMVANSKWAYVKTQSYNDLTLTRPMPEGLDKLLVPLSIRNKAMQKFRNTRRTYVPNILNREDEDEEMALSAKIEKPIRNGTIIIIPPEIYDEEW